MRYCFDSFVFDTGRRELSRDGAVLSTQPQVLDLLAHLIEHRDKVVSKQQLIDAVWNHQAVSDAAVTTRINILRKVLGDSGVQQKFIRTHPRKGFRFVGIVRREMPMQVIGPLPVETELPSIAILAFSSAGDAGAQSFLGDALAEELLIGLARLRWLLVIARNSSFSYRGHAVDVREIGAQLGVRYVLEGSALHDRDRIRITCRLVDARTALQIWGSRFDRNLTDVFEVLDEIADAIVGEIGPAILDAERNRIDRLPTAGLNTWESYQRGIAHMLKPSVEGNGAARQFFHQAVTLRSDYSPGFDGLAWTHLVDASVFSRISIDEGCNLSEPLARKSLELDPENASARARLALTLHLRGDNEAAVEETDVALASSPNCADACGARGAALVFSGRYGEGRVALEKFLRLSPRDPAKPIRLSQLAASYYLEKDYENSVRIALQTIREFPNVPMSYRWMAAALGQLGDRAEGSRVLDTLQTFHAPSMAAYVRQRPRYFSVDDHEHLIEGLRKAGWPR